MTQMTSRIADAIRRGAYRAYNAACFTTLFSYGHMQLITTGALLQGLILRTTLIRHVGQGLSI
jgi:hypothetical protein